MGQITIDEIHNSLFDYAQAVSDENLITESKTVVGAINEIYGKKLIANAIGEPLNSTDTYAKMNNDINSLLSTFKTNMMNAGVVVESNDKFKSLIEKIKGLTEGEGNKGIQYASGESVSFLDNVYKFSIDFSELSFVPSLIIATTVWNSAYVPMIIYTTLDTDIPDGKYFYTQFINTAESTQNLPVGLFEAEIYDNVIYFTAEASDRKYIWHAFGVGEEDTTLRDSLASILEDEGVDVTEEDTMADLIVKTDEEFDRKNANSAKLDIIFASELPTTVKEGQVVIISNTEGNVYINKIDSGNLINGDVFIEVNHLESVVDMPIQTEGIDVGIPIYRANQFNNGVGSQVMCYVGKNGKWIETVPNDIYLYSPEQGLHPKLGEFVLNSSTVSFGAEYLTFVAKASSGTMTTRTATSKNKIDVTRFTKLEVIAGGNTYGANSGQALKVSIGTKSAFMVDQNGKYTKTVDITDLTGEHNLVLSCSAAYNDNTCLIYSIRLYA